MKLTRMRHFLIVTLLYSSVLPVTALTNVRDTVSSRSAPIEVYILLAGVCGTYSCNHVIAVIDPLSCTNIHPYRWTSPRPIGLNCDAIAHAHDIRFVLHL